MNKEAYIYTYNGLLTNLYLPITLKYKSKNFYEI